MKTIFKGGNGTVFFKPVNEEDNSTTVGKINRGKPSSLSPGHGSRADALKLKIARAGDGQDQHYSS
jgi:hypothetical protein